VKLTGVKVGMVPEVIDAVPVHPNGLPADDDLTGRPGLAGAGGHGGFYLLRIPRPPREVGRARSFCLASDADASDGADGGDFWLGGELGTEGLGFGIGGPGAGLKLLEFGSGGVALGRVIGRELLIGQ